MSEPTDLELQAKSSVPRQRVMTTKGKEYYLERLKVNYRSAKRTWRSQLNALVSSLVTDADISALKLQCLKLEKHMIDLSKAHEGLDKELIVEEEKIALYDELEMLTKENMDHLKMVDNVGSQRSCSSSSYQSSSRKSSSHASSSHKSSRHQASGHQSSRHSSSHESSSHQSLSNHKSSSHVSSSYKSRSVKSSTCYRKQLALQGQIAALKAKIDLSVEKREMESIAQKQLEDIHKQRSELTLTEGRIKGDLRRYTDGYKTKEDLVQTEAKLNVCNRFMQDDVHVPSMTEDQLPQGDGSKDQMQKFLEQVELEYVNQSGKKNFHSMPIASGSLSVNQPSSNAHIPINKDVDAHESVDTHGTSSSTNSNIVTTQLIEIVKTLVENQNYSKLPSPEPGIFSGDLLHYPIWIQAFETLIENKTTRTNERIHFLRKYVAGEAKEAIDGLLLLNSDDAYQKAKEMLSKRFGDPFAIASAYRQKLESWPKIQNSDAKGLRKFTDFLAHCEKAMDGISSLRVLDDDQENRKMAAKLPKWITNRWAREVYQYKEDSGMFPSFKKFVKFLIKESDIANDPVFSAQNQELPLSKKPKDTLKPFKVASTFSVGTQKEDEHGQQCCLVCKSSHDIDICEEFLKKTVQERKEFAMINRLCFGCLKEGHRSKDCKERKTCKNCNRLHPSSLHGDVKRETTKDVKADKSTETINQATSNYTKVKFHTVTYSMIVPVWIYHKDDPGNERLTYALLDDQSDTTFVKEKLLEDLGVKGERTQLSLTTLHAESKLVDTYKVKGLAVRDLNRQVTMMLPRTFTRFSIPAQRNQIPRPEAARQFKKMHLLKRRTLFVR